MVAEFERHLHDELDLMREAANASQLRRNFADSPLLRVPEVYWDYCSSEVMVMERMIGTPISQVDALRAQGVDIPQLARNGVEIFFTQVFRDGFFHADMHPGQHPGRSRRAATSRSISASWARSPRSTRTIWRRISSPSSGATTGAWRRRTWRRAGCRKDTRVDEFETAIRAVCEPVFDRPLKEISFGRVLLRLFQTSRRFNVEIQPQLVLLQKTLLNIEGLGRDLDPDLDLWKTAKPYLERWMSEQIGWRGLVAQLATGGAVLGRACCRSCPGCCIARLADETTSRICGCICSSFVPAQATGALADRRAALLAVLRRSGTPPLLVLSCVQSAAPSVYRRTVGRHRVRTRSLGTSGVPSDLGCAASTCTVHQTVTLVPQNPQPDAGDCARVIGMR